MPTINVKEHKKHFKIEVASPCFMKKDFEAAVLQFKSEFENGLSPN